MYCEKCKNFQATIHLTEIIKEVKSEVHLCEECARQIGLNSKLSDFRLSVPEMLSFLDLNEIEDSETSDFCGICGRSCVESAKSRVLGCAFCYSAFGNQIMPVIKRVQGGEKHIGKTPENHSGLPVFCGYSRGRMPERETIKELGRLLDSAVTEERYEEAAHLRDKIRSYGIK